MANDSATALSSSMPADGYRDRSISLPAMLLLALAVAAGIAMQAVFGPLQELVKHQMLLTDIQMSLLQGMASAVPVAIFSIPIGRLADYRSRVRLLMWMTLVGTAGALLTAVAKDFWLLLLARALAATGTVCGLPVALSMAADLSSKQRRGLAQTILFIGKLLGAVGAYALAGSLLAALKGSLGTIFGGLADWRSIHIIFAMSGLVLAVALLFMKEPQRSEMGARANPSAEETIRTVWRFRSLLIPIFIGGVAVAMADTAASIWAAPVLVRDYHQGPEQFGQWMGALILVSGVVGTVAGGQLADWGSKKKLKGGVLAGGILGAVLSVPAALFPIMPTAHGFALMLGLLLVSGSITALATTTALTVLVPNEYRGVCLGAFMVVGALLGLGVAPTLVTLISAALGGEAFVRQGLAVVGVLGSLVAVFGFAVASRSARRWDFETGGHPQ